MDLQERKLFEYFIVVALHKTKAGVPYLPEVTQQFPLKVRPHWALGTGGGGLCFGLACPTPSRKVPGSIPPL